MVFNFVVYPLNHEIGFPLEMDVFLRVSVIEITLPVTITWGGFVSSSCRGQAGSAGRGAGEGIASLRGSQNLSRESMLFFICPLKSGDTAGRGRVRKGTRVIISTVGIFCLRLQVWTPFYKEFLLKTIP